MEKPASIVLFDRLYLGSLVLGVLNFILNWGDLSARITAAPEFAATGFGSGFIIVSFAIGMAINLILWYFISARASRIAKWILIAFFAIGLVSMIRSLDNSLAPQGLSFVIAILVTLLQAGAIYMLFRPDSSAWFDGKPPVNPDTFR